MIECLRELDRTAFTPHVIQLRPGPLEECLKAIDVRVHVLESHRMRQVHRIAGAILSIRSIVRREGIALLHSNGFRAHVYGGLAGIISGTPEVWTTHTVEVPSWSTTLISKIPTRRVLSNCPRTDDAFQRMGFRTTMIWPGVNAAHLEALAKSVSRSDLEQRYQVPSGRRWLTVGARLQRYKGHPEFLEALATLPAEANVHGIILGGTLFNQESGLRSELEAQAVRLGIRDRVTFTGYVPDGEFAAFLALSTVVVHPAHDEDFGLTVAEAQALGIPVAAFAAVGPSAILDPGKTGWLVPIGDVHGLTAALNEALIDGVRVLEMGSAARSRSRTLFGAATHAKKTASVYREVLAEAS
jgi:glycosyltransferase involved in cell wall biosynthesis